MPGRVLTKRCSSPSHNGDPVLPLDAFHRAPKEKDGRGSRCKECIAREYRENPRVRAQQKIRSRRWYAKNGKAVRESLKRRYQKDAGFREEVKQRAKGWREEFPERSREVIQRSKAAKPELYREIRRRYARENREKLRARYRAWVEDNRERARAHSKRYYEANRNYYHAAKLLRRARERANGGNVTKAKLKARWDYFGGKCWMCGEEATCFDHVKPVAKGGGSWASNLRPACKSCNQKKGARWPWGCLAP